MTYFDKLKEWKSPNDVLKFIKTFKYASDFLPDTKDCLKNYKTYYPKMLSLTELFEGKKGTCTNIYYFFIKTVNTIHLSYASFAITMTWRGPWSGVNKICFWFDDIGLRSFRWTGDNGGSIILNGPFRSLWEAKEFYIGMARESLKPKDIQINYGISILDVRTALDYRIQEALRAFGVDDGYSMYRKDF